MRLSSSFRLRPPYIFGSRRASTSRFAPFRTRTCISDQSPDERIQRGSNLARRPSLDDRPVVAEEHEVDRLAGALLVAEQRVPGAVAVDGDRLRIELPLDPARIAAREPERRHQAERDRIAVRQLEARRSLEGVRERVPEVEPLPDVAVVRVAEAERRL